MLRKLFLATLLFALFGTLCCSPLFAFGPWWGGGSSSIGFLPFLVIFFGTVWLFLGLPTILVGLLVRWVIGAFKTRSWNGEPSQPDP